MLQFRTLDKTRRPSACSDSGDDIVSAVLTAHRAGAGRVRLMLPSISQKLEIALDIMKEMRANTAIASPNLAVQSAWMDKYRNSNSYFVDTAGRIWPETPMHAVSALHYSSAPVLLLTDSVLQGGGDLGDAESGDSRLLRNMIRRRCRLLILDCPDLLSPEWTAFSNELIRQTQALVLEIRNDCALTSSGASALPADPPEFAQSASALVRDGRLSPFISLAHIAYDRADIRNDTSKDPAAPSIAAGATHVLTEEMQALKTELRALLLFDDGTGDIQNNCSGSAENIDVASFPWMSLLTTPPFREARSALFTGASIICLDEHAASIVKAVRLMSDNESWDMRLSQTRNGELLELMGAGRDWNSRTYFLLANELLIRNTICCIMAPRSIAASGWPELQANSVLDCTSSDRRFFIGQNANCTTRDDAGRPVVYWNILSGFIDHALPARAAILRESAYAAPAADGVVAFGIEHADPAIIEPGELELHIIIAVNERSKMRAAARSDILHHWKTGQPYENQTHPAVLLHCPALAQRAPEAAQRRSIIEECARWQSRRAASRLHTALAAIATVALALSSVMYLPIEHGIAAAVALCLSALVLLLIHLRALHSSKPLKIAVSPAAYVALLAQSVLTALDRADILSKSPIMKVNVATPAEGWFRVSVDADEPGIRESFARAFTELCGNVGPGVRAVSLSALETGRLSLRALSRIESFDSLYKPDGVLPIPSMLADTPARRGIFAKAVSELFARCVVIDAAGDSSRNPELVHHLPARSTNRSMTWM